MSEIKTFDHNTHVDSSTNKNSTKIKCSRCPSLILNKNTAVFTDKKEHELPLVRQSRKDLHEAEPFENEVIHEYWLVNDMLTFENVGFTNTLDNKKYLICADCEIGPIGFQNLDNKSELYLACNRVSYGL